MASKSLIFQKYYHIGNSESLKTMSQLTELIYFCLPSETELIRQLQLKGRRRELLCFLLNMSDRQPSSEEIQSALNLTVSHLNKLSFQLLLNCYEAISEGSESKLLNVLSIRAGLTGHYHKEVIKLVQNYKTEKPDMLPGFILENLQRIKDNIPLSRIDERLFNELADEYVSCFSSARENELAAFKMKCNKMLIKISLLFAQAKVKDMCTELESQLNIEFKVPENCPTDVLFEYYWLQIYFYHAIEEFEKSMSFTEKGLELLQNSNAAHLREKYWRLRLKKAEQLYFNSRFSDSHAAFLDIFNNPPEEGIPERGYYATKFLQICLITAHPEHAWAYVLQFMVESGYTHPDKISLRDCISFVKYYLLKDDYQTALQYLHIGFERNPKAKYVQYEIELRNLHTAILYLSGDSVTALEHCEKNIKFLRSHGYHVKNSYFPAYYFLIKEFCDTSDIKSPKALQKQVELMGIYHSGSFALYGCILDKIKYQKPR